MRELSAQLTEGEIPNSPIYAFAYTAKIAVNIQIVDAETVNFLLSKFFVRRWSFLLA